MIPHPHERHCNLLRSRPPSRSNTTAGGGISLSVDLRSRYEQYAGQREHGHNSCKFLSVAFSAFANLNLQRWTMPNNETAEYCLAAIMPIISNGGEQLDEDSDYEYGIV